MTSDGTAAPRLVLGPLLRYVAETAATVWVETDAACDVEVLGHHARTFEVAGHHYGLVVADGLQPGRDYEYAVALDGVVRWPERNSAFPPSTIRTYGPGRPFRFVFGSCRLAAPHVPPFTLGRDRHQDGREVDALVAFACRMRESPREHWPDFLLLLGDQVYADELAPETRQFIRERRDPAQPPGYQVADFGEYCFLYREAWSEPRIRWLLSTVPTAMIFDDHDVHDDWNISAAWVAEYRAKPWWRDRIVGAYMSYWIYQHLGNLSPGELARDELWHRVREAGDAASLLGDFALRADRTTEGIQWSFRREFGGVRLVVIDSRGGRVLDGGSRLMVDEAEWQWVRESACGDWDHVVLATSLPALLPGGFHGLEAWNEAVCDGAWGHWATRLAERVRRGADLEHWAAFGRSFAAFGRLLTDLAAGKCGEPPASVTVVSGDVHYAYLAAVDFPAGLDTRSAVYQAVCSPMRNPVPRRLRRLQRIVGSRPGELAGRALARLAGVGPPEITWRTTHGPWFHNELSVLEYQERTAHIRMDRAVPGAVISPRLEPVYQAELA